MILLSKLEAYGIRGIPLRWFQSYLSNRKQYVALGEVKSPEQAMLFTREYIGTSFVFNVHK